MDISLIFFFLYNLYRFIVIRGKFMFVTVLNFVKKTRHFPIYILGKFH